MRYQPLDLKQMIAAICCMTLVVPPWAAGQPPGQYRITVNAGEDRTIDLKTDKSSRVAVVVRNAVGQGVPNVPVTFRLPNYGAGGNFINGSKQTVATTDAAGLASVSYTPANIGGIVKIVVSASVNGQTIQPAEISQTIREQPKANHTPLYVALAGGAVAGIVYAALRCNKPDGCKPVEPPTPTIAPTISSGTLGQPKP